MAGTIRIGGNTIATHAGSEGAGTVTLDSSTLTIGSNTTIQGAMNAGSLTSGVTFPAGHIIQVVNHVSTTNATTTNATGVTAVSGAITLSNATNKIWAMAVVQASTGKTSGQDSYFGFSMECTSATTVSYGPKDDYGWYAVRIDGAHSNGAGTLGAQYPLSELFEPDQSGAITVTVKGHSYPSVNNTLSVNSQSTIDGRSTLTLMEVVAI